MRLDISGQDKGLFLDLGVYRHKAKEGVESQQRNGSTVSIGQIHNGHSRL